MSSSCSGGCRTGPITKRCCVSARGFTLAELLVTMGIGLVMTAIAVPAVKSTLNSYRLNSAVASVSGSIQSTRYRAIAAGYPFSVTFSKANSTLQVKSDPLNSGTFTNVGGAIPFSSAQVLGQDTVLTFRPGGAVQSPQADANGNTSMTMTYAGKTETLTVSVYGRTNVTP